MRRLGSALSCEHAARQGPAELADLAVTRKVLLSLQDETERDGSAHLPDNPVYQHILTVLADADRPGPCAPRTCQTLDLGLEPNKIENMRSKLKRLVARGLIVEAEPGLFALPHQ